MNQEAIERYVCVCLCVCVCVCVKYSITNIIYIVFLGYFICMFLFTCLYLFLFLILNLLLFIYLCRYVFLPGFYTTDVCCEILMIIHKNILLCSYSMFFLLFPRKLKKKSDQAAMADQTRANISV